jgi:hypothetical protein
MADVVNQGKKVASTSSGLDATTGGATDNNWNPTKTVSSPHVNKAPLADATEHASKTEMSGGKTVREGDKIGPPSKDPHADTGGGVGSGTYIKEAKDTSGSPNVKAEGAPVARDKDGTTQNHANTTGQVLDPGAAAALAKAQEEAKKACSMDLIKAEHATPVYTNTFAQSVGQVASQTGHNAVAVGVPVAMVAAPAAAPMLAGQMRAPMAPSPSGPSAGTVRTIEKSRFLEIVDKNPTILKAKRKNAKHPGAPECQHSPNHTKWIISRKKGGGMAPLVRELFGDDQTLEEAWYNPGLEFGIDLKSEDNDPFNDQKARDRAADRSAQRAGERAAEQNAGDQIGRRSREMRGLDPNTTDSRVVGERTPLTGDRAGARQAARDEWNNGGRDQYAQQQADRARTRADRAQRAQSLATVATERAQSIMKWLEVYNFDKDPRKINVQALACSGSQNFELIIYPYAEQDFTCGTAEYEIIGGAFQRVQSFIDWGQRLINLVGGRVRIEVVWLQEPEVKLTCQWKELTRDVPAIGRTKYQCNKAVDFSITIKRLLGCEVRVGVPLSALLNAIPGLGWVAQKIIDYIADAQVGIRFKLDLAVGVKAGWNEYEEWQSASLQISFPFELFIYATVGIRRLGSVEVQCGCRGEPTFNNLKKYPPENDIGFDLAEGKIEPGIRAMFRIRALWWKRDESGEWFPESWKFRYGSQTFRPLRSLFSRNNG